MKKRMLSGLLTGLICCSLVGVGFASWVITGDATDSTQPGTIQAEGITDKSLSIKSMEWGTGAENDANIYFGAPATMTTENAWLINDNAGKEDLTAVLTVTLDNPGNIDVTVNATLSENGGTTKMQTAEDSNLIAKPIVETTASQTPNVYTVKVTFKWGSAFGGINPYTFYNGKNASDVISNQLTYKQDALDKINLLNELNGASYKLTVTAKDATKLK